MVHRPSKDEALGLLRSEIGPERGEFAASAAEDLWPAWLRFGGRRFDVPDVPDADGLLLQYGTYAFDGPPMFLLDFVRQFEIVDSDGLHDQYVQVHCELRYEPTPLLDALGSFDSWFFHDSGDELEQWAAEFTEGAGWKMIRGLKPAEVRVYQERV
ncbi:hypothetical protein [Streptomyces sp. NBC_00102]|uniref:hypothetical protein n=1 Tax=Streptomyces sp. NBC_00102 TaxID=2975652 RepID=UPI00225B5F3A|nr:hypothetical protein [Streptomyces sp. NBC_00102]MCX5401430.1 hypothetical protein [Streptomyces sp. NBC_00102]